MASRIIAGLSYAACCLRPANIPKSRPRGARAAGLRYEKALAAAVPGAIAGQWFEFFDANGPGHCQTDLLIVGKRRVVVIEAKLSDVEGGRRQIESLYIPVVRAVWPELKPLGIVAVRHLGRELDESRVVNTLEEAVRAAEEFVPTLHWIERTPLRARRGK
jgi:hypothetical protein